jgi:hypothetical protein
LVTGIRLFNRELGKGGSGIDDCTFIVTASSFLRRTHEDRWKQGRRTEFSFAELMLGFLLRTVPNMCNDEISSLEKSLAKHAEITNELIIHYLGTISHVPCTTLLELLA